MDMLEYEGKDLLAKHGVKIPPGQLITAVGQFQGLQYPLALKSQVPIGGRGKAGGIRMVNNAQEAGAAYEQIKALKIKGYSPRAILAEATVAIQQELYFSLSIDRQNKMETLLFSEAGGMEIEEVDKNQIKVIQIDPLVGLQNYQLNTVFLRTGLREEIKAKAREMVQKLYSVFKTNRLELLEINPLVVTPAGDLVCLDAKIVVDDSLMGKRDKTATAAPLSFEEKMKALGIHGVELDGDIAVVASGAGCGLSTIDTIKFHGGTIRAFVDLGPLVHDREKAEEVVKAVHELKPKVILFNFYFQVASCENLANSIVSALQEIPVVVRVKGRYEEEARSLLKLNNCEVTGDFRVAVAKALELVAGGKD